MTRESPKTGSKDSLQIDTETALEQWIRCHPQDLQQGVLFDRFRDKLGNLLLENPTAGIAIVDTALKHAFANIKRRMLYVVAYGIVLALVESNRLEMVNTLDDSSYRLAVTLALSVHHMDHFDKRALASNEAAIRFLTNSDFEFSRNYNKHREQTTVALFGQAWTTLYMDDLTGPSSVLNVLLQTRAPLAFLENTKQSVALPADMSLE